MTIVKKDLLDKIIIEQKTNLVNYPYCMLLEIRDIKLSKKLGKKT